MTDRFGDGAVQLCGIAAALLGWRPAEFWDSTPAELATALGPRGEAMEAVEPELITELRRRFPDE